MQSTAILDLPGIAATRTARNPAAMETEFNRMQQELPRTPPSERPGEPSPPHGPGPKPEPERLPGEIPEPGRTPEESPPPVYARRGAVAGEEGTSPVSAAEQCPEIERRLIGASAAMDAVRRMIVRVAPTDSAVLIRGESGCGKELVAESLHAASPRADGPFVAINCGAIPATLIEAELFGYEKGSFTGASRTHAGVFERADGGTLLLDELGELPLTAQAKLLRVLQTGEVERLGAVGTRKVDVRVVAATNVDLEAAVAAGRFRRDLMYRLNVYPIRIPPLRERVEDIEPLAAHLLHRFEALHGKRVAGFSDRALDAMRRYPWPGNVRELENLIERGVILANPGGPIDLDQLFPTLQVASPVVVNAQGELERGPCSDAAALYDDVQRRGLSLEALEDALMREAVARADGNLAAAARALGMTRPQLSYRLQRLRARAQQ
jgi:DNA-binding NtrC family response regulator